MSESPFDDLENAVFSPDEAIKYLEIDDLSLENLRKIKATISAWTDEDMKQAHAAGAASASGRTADYYMRNYNNGWTVFRDWIDKYKSKR